MSEAGSNADVSQDQKLPPTTKRLLLEGTLVWAACVVAYSIAAKDLALGWDEGYTFARVEAVRPWVHGVISLDSASRRRWMQPKVVHEHWRFSREEPDGHGPFYALLSLAGFELSSRWLPPPMSYRLGSIVLFSVAVAVVYTTLRRCWGFLPCLLATCLLATTPRLMPEVCYALVDGPLVSLALLAWCCFVRGVEGESWKARFGYGVALGSAMATKLTGWFFIFPYLAWACWTLWIYRPAAPGEDAEETQSRQRQLTLSAFATLAVGVPVALATVFAWNVGWWSDPVAAVQTYFHSNLTRDETVPIGIQFLGTRYDFSLPWYNTLVWTVVATPAGALALGMLGLGWTLTRWRSGPLGMLIAMNWGLLMVVRALPQAPGHDGARQIVTSFAFLALLAGYGFERLWRLAGEGRAAGIKRTLAALVGIAALMESAWSIGRYHPYQLSYYSPLVGGLPGATRKGFEPTYFWDSLTPDVLAWLDENTGPDEWVLFRNNPVSFQYLSQWRKIQFRHTPGQTPGDPKWVVYQHRPGLFLPADDWLIEHGKPEYRKTLMGVALLSIYPFEQFKTAQTVAKQAEPSKTAKASGLESP